MKTVSVVAAIILEGKEVFATQRGYGELQGGWEFPGGKIENGETPQEALRREIKEELDTDIEVIKLFDTVEYDYPSFHLTMRCYLCKRYSGDLILKEHKAACWLNKNSLNSVNWLPADIMVVEKLKDYLKMD